MKIQWLTAALLSSAVLVGCGGTDSNQNPNETAAPPAATATDQAAPAQPAEPPARDTAAARPDTSGAQSTSGNRTAAARPSAPARPSASVNAAPRAEAPAPPARPAVRYVTVPAGTTLPLELTTAVSTETARVETPVTARLRRDIEVNGVTALPAGAVFHGEVVESERPGRVQGRARLGIRFTSVTVDGTREDLRTNPVTFQGEASKGEDATKIGAGAGIGAVIGGIVGGGDGAAKGAAIGGAAGTGAVLATRGKDVELPAGTDINATLTSEIDVRAR